MSAWLRSRVAGDPFLDGLIMPGEVASVSVAHRAFELVPDVPYQHTELLGAIWRESVEGFLRPGERAISLAALLHRDPAGVAFAEPLIARSGLTVDAWVARLHEVTLPPLLHVLYRYGAAFSPHAQNCMLVLRDDVPVRLVVKDFVDDMMVSSDPLPELADMPADVRAALGDGVEAAILVQWIQGGLLVCVHRYLCEIFDDRLGYPEASFWAAAERAVARLPGTVPGARGSLRAVRHGRAGVREAVPEPRADARARLRGRRRAARRRGRGLDRESSGPGMTHSELAVHVEHEPALDRRLWARPALPEYDTELLWTWMHKAHVVQFWAMDWPEDWIRDYLVRQNEDPARSPLLGFVDDTPVGYIEVYDPARDVLGAHAPVLPGDIGAHVLIGEEEHLGRYSVAIGRAVVRFLFKRPGVLRIVGEPDVRNHQFLSLLAFLGFRKAGEIDLPDKRAAFMVCEREDFERLSGRRRRVSA